MFPSILVQLKTKMVRMNFIFYLINLAAVEKTKRKNIALYWHESEGNTKIKWKNFFFFFFFQFTKNWVGRVRKTKNKKNSGLI